MTTNGFDPQFTVKMEGRAISEFSTREDLTTLAGWLKHNKWRGELKLQFAGNGGITSVVFEEKKRMTDDSLTQT